MTALNFDEWGEVVNGDGTYQGIAEELGKRSVIVGWSDGDGTHFDILFTLTALRFGDQIQGGLRPAKDLFVSIMRKGAFAFDPEHKDTAAGYYSEKLGGYYGRECSEKVAELINGVKKYL